MDDNKTEKLRHRIALGAAVSVFFVFTFVLYAPLKLYIENKDVLWFDFQSVLIVSLLMSVVVFGLTLLLTSLPKNMIHTGICCLVFATALGLFIQGNFLNIDYGSGVLDGSEIAWKDYTTYGAINSAVWAACLAMPFAFWMVFRAQWRKILMFASLGLVLVQAVILTSVITQNSSNLDKVTYEVTRDGIYELSENENTVVFVMDSFDDQYFEKIKKNFPDYKKRLSGFTEYNNTLSTGSGSSVALPSLLTGEVFKKDTPYKTYIDTIWEDETVYSILSKNNVDTRIFAQTAYFSGDAKDYIENIVDYMDSPSAYASMTGIIYKYAAYSYSPHYLKQFFWMDLKTISSYKSENVYTLNDSQFYADYVNEQGFTYTDEYSDALRIYNLNGARPPYTLTKSTIKNPNGTTLNDQVYGCFNSLFSMIDDMKENGVYEDANIIITANIGNKGMAQNPILLIKEAGKSDGYEVSNAPLSAFDFAPTLASKYTDGYRRFGSGKTYMDFDDGDTRTRYFYMNSGFNNETNISRYATVSDAKNYEDMVLLKTYYSTEGVKKYRLGKSLTFTMDATANQYCIQGFSSTTGWRTPLAGPQSQMVIPIENVPNDTQDVHVFFKIHSIDKPSKCVIYANGRQVFTAKISESFVNDGLNFTVPAHLIEENDNTLVLRFDFPEISDNEVALEQNKRTKTFSVESFKMYTQ